MGKMINPKILRVPIGVNHDPGRNEDTKSVRLSCRVTPETKRRIFIMSTRSYAGNMTAYLEELVEAAWKETVDQRGSDYFAGV